MILPTQKPDAILFDWDGTLADSMAWIMNVHNAVRVRLGIQPWSNDEFAYYSKWSSREIYPEIYGDRATTAFEYLNEEIAKGSTVAMDKIPAAEPMLEALHLAQIPMGVVSNKIHAPLTEDVNCFGWNHFFQTIVGAGRAARDKPSGVPALFALDELAILPSKNIWFVGDSGADADCAKDAGLFFIGIGARLYTPRKEDGIIFPSLDDFSKALQKLSW